MTIRRLAAVFFVLYGVMIPIAASGFVAEYPIASLAMMASCVVIAALLRSGRAVVINLVIAGYVLRVYLTRPYINVFLEHLDGVQRAYIDGNSSFFNAHDATVVYLSLLSLLAAWLIGLHTVKPKGYQTLTPPRLFRRLDEMVADSDWRFWVSWVILTVLNYRSPTESYQGIATGEGVSQFAFGVLATTTIDVVCLYAFLRLRQEKRRASFLLLVPVMVSVVRGIASGGRGAMFTTMTLTLTYWFFLHFNKRVSRSDVVKAVGVMFLLPAVILAGLRAQELRPLLRGGTDPEVIAAATWNNLNVLNPDNQIISDLSFGLTQLLHRLSSLEAPFRILGNHWVHDPWETCNPAYIAMRTINALLPMSLKPFGGLLTINQLFDYVYYDSPVVYSSMMWSIQGTLYLMCGLWLSPFVVFVMARLWGRYCEQVDALVMASPACAAFTILLLGDIIENGTIERVFGDEVVRALIGFVAVTAMVRLLRVLSSVRPYAAAT